VVSLIVVDVIIVEVVVLLPDVEKVVLLGDIDVRTDVVKDFVKNFLVGPVGLVLVTRVGIFLDCFELLFIVLSCETRW